MDYSRSLQKPARQQGRIIQLEYNALAYARAFAFHISESGINRSPN